MKIPNWWANFHQQVIVNSFMKKKLIIRLSIFVIILLFILNNGVTKYFIPLPSSWPHKYCADKGNFCTLEKGKGRDTFGSVLIAFNRYKDETKQPDLVLYRRFYRKWWQVWNWGEYIFAPYWSCPYAESDENT